MTQVADAVIAELHEAGLHGLSVPRIAQRAGVHTASIYRRWPSTAELIAFATTRLTDDVMPSDDTGTLEGDLRAMLHHVRDFLDSPNGSLLASIAFAAGSSPEIEVITSTHWHQRVQSRQAMFSRAVARGELQSDVDAEELIERMIGPLYVRRFISRRPASDAFLERLLASAMAETSVTPHKS